jgi:hypothetical protein
MGTTTKDDLKLIIETVIIGNMRKDSKLISLVNILDG